MHDKKVGIVDYGMGNSKSVANMLRKIGVSSLVTDNPEELKLLSKIVLPGVGSFESAMMKLKERGLDKFLKDKANEKKTAILGICLGMQLLSKGSEEGLSPGLGLIEGKVKKFNFSNLSKDNLKIPHMGWNVVSTNEANNVSIFEKVPQPMRFYFVHSYHFVCSNPDNLLATTYYGYKFASAVVKENIYGVQFHPEKSHKFGMKLLKNFTELSL